MPWKENHVIDQKREFVLESLKEDTNFTRLCGKYCISTKTGYKWKQRFLERGFAGLEDLSRKPQSCPGQLNEDEIIDILKLKGKKKHWGARKIRELYSRQYPGRRLPALSTFNRLFKKAGVTIPRKRNRKCTGVRCQHRSKSAGFHRSKTAGSRQKYIRSQRLLFSTGLSSGMNLLQDSERENDGVACPA